MSRPPPSVVAVADDHHDVDLVNLFPLLTAEHGSTILLRVSQWWLESANPSTPFTLGSWAQFYANPRWASGAPPASWAEHCDAVHASLLQAHATFKQAASKGCRCGCNRRLSLARRGLHAGAALPRAVQPTELQPTELELRVCWRQRRSRARGSLARRTVSSPPVPCCPCEGVMCLWCVLVCLKARTQLRGTLNQCTLTVRGLPLVSGLVTPAPVSLYAASAVARSGAIGQLRVPGVTSQHAAAVPRVRRAAAVVLLLGRCCYGRVGLLLRWS